MFLHDLIPEADLSWEYYLSGGLLRLNIDQVDTDPLTAVTWQWAYTGPHIEAIVDMRWMHEWFLNDTWASTPAAEECRRRHQWGKAGSTAGKPEPRAFYAQRLDGNKGGSMKRLLYVDKKLVDTGSDVLDGGVDIGLSMSLDEWYVKVRKMDEERALTAGYDKEYFDPVGSWGPYEDLRFNSRHEPTDKGHDS